MSLENFISIIGQGYVGLPLSIAASVSGFTVCGIDNNEINVAALNSGVSTIEGLDSKSLKKLIANKKLFFSQDFSQISNSKIVLICVPTPLDSLHKPDLEILISASKSVGKFLTKDTLVIVESTVAPGTTRNIIADILVEESGLNLEDFCLAYSPERIDPLNKKWNLRNTPKLVAGLNRESCNRAISFYSNFIEDLVECNTLEEAELAKILENSFRLINISLINEISIFCNKFKIDINEVIKAASTKPYGFMPFYPSIGVGGHCIPVDPIYLAEEAKNIGSPIHMIDLAAKINQKMPGYFVTCAEEMLNGLIDKEIVVLGVAYKPNVSDVRETPAEALIDGLKAKGAKVTWHDDLVKVWRGEKSVTLNRDFDLAIIATPHDYLDLSILGEVPILHTRGSI